MQGMQSHPSHIPVLIFMSDGAPHDEAEVPEAVKNVRKRVRIFQATFFSWAQRLAMQASLKTSVMIGANFSSLQMVLSHFLCRNRFRIDVQFLKKITLQYIFGV